MLTLRVAARVAFLLLVVAPVAAWSLVKPVRVIAPSLMGLDCPATGACVEDPTTLQAATQLYTEALAFVAQNVSPVAGEPRVIFCATEACADAFGLGARSAVTLGTTATVIGPHAWRSYYVRHELIHQLQGQRLGVVHLLTKPTWFVEGMAYSLSLDTRASLAQPFEGYRARFAAWYLTVGPQRLRVEAGKL